MNRHILTIHEKFSKTWPAVAAVSSLSAIILFAYSRIQSEVLLSGYLELASFILFSVAVFSLIKLRDGRITIKVEREDDSLRIQYIRRNKTVYSEYLPVHSIRDLKYDRMPDSSLYSEIDRSDRTILFREKISDGWSYLFQYNSRVIPLTVQEAKNAVKILEDHIKK